MFDTLINDELYMFQNTRMANNSYIIINKKTAIVIDPSWNGKSIINFLKEKKISVVKIFITHAHYDHIVDIDKIYKEFKDVTFYISEHESIHLRQISSNMAFKSPSTFPKEKIFEIKSNNTEIKFGQEIIGIFLSPGHSKGSITFIYKQYIFTGDFIFSDCIGRTDLPTGNLEEMKKSLKRFLKFAKDDSIICPGHNQISLFKIVKVYNDELNEYSK
ncbi:MBL fold metallo-hydrolase [Malacoplasma muris]|uniref:MBL fold metallo-hydrolase n=1 Tax=Malacoplasma muris TaxID=2119 RepID=UPI00398ED699